MESINLQIPIESVEKGEKAIIQEIAIQLYKQQIFTFGQARRLLNVSTWELQKILGENQVERHYDEKDFIEDLTSIETKNWTE